MRAIIPLLSAVLLAPAKEAPLPDEAELRAMTARFAPVEVKVDLSGLPANERPTLAKMVEAAKIFDALYYRQVAPLNLTYLAGLWPTNRSRPLPPALFLAQQGPWSQLDEHRPFVPGVGPSRRVAASTRRTPDRRLQPAER